LQLPWRTLFTITRALIKRKHEFIFYWYFSRFINWWWLIIFLYNLSLLLVCLFFCNHCLFLSYYIFLFSRPGLYANTSKKKTIFELYHIEKCVDIHCLYNSTSIKLNHIEEPSLKDREIGYPSSKIPLCKKRKPLTETTYDNSQIGTIDLSTIGSTCKMVNTTNMKNLSMRTDGSRKKQKKSKKSNKLQIYVQARRNKSTKG